MQATKSSGLVGFGLMVILFTAVPAMAQERQDFPNDDRNQLEVNQTLDLHGNVIKENHRDSLVVKPLVVVPAAKPKTEGKKKDEETLSYNFLYYIIQKFKGSDVVD